MNRKWLNRWSGIFSLVVAGVLALNLSSCGHDEQLVSISITPASETFGASDILVSEDAGLNVQLRALGSYIHPPVTKDITNQVTWSSNSPNVANVNSSGVLTAAGIDCGNTLISATVQTNSSSGGVGSSGAIVTAYMTANVVCFTGTGMALAVNFAGAGSGTVTSAPLGLSCASTAKSCRDSFPSGTDVTLTAAPDGTFGGWTGCDLVSRSGLTCTVRHLASDRGITATFN